MVIRRSNTQPIKDIIKDYLKENNLDKKLNEQEMIRSWYEITGKMVARATVSVDIRNRKMYIKLSSSVVRNELTMIRDELVKRLNQQFKEPLIDEIILK
jgi:predicted nucleic acid-binding Zn ribbon protein